MKYSDITSLALAMGNKHTHFKLYNKIESLLGKKVKGIVRLKNAERNVAVVRGTLQIDEEYKIYIIGQQASSMVTFKLDDIDSIDAKSHTITIMVS